MKGYICKSMTRSTVRVHLCLLESAMLRPICALNTRVCGIRGAESVSFTRSRLVISVRLEVHLERTSQMDNEW